MRRRRSAGGARLLARRGARRRERGSLCGEGFVDREGGRRGRKCWGRRGNGAMVTLRRKGGRQRGGVVERPTTPPPAAEGRAEPCPRGGAHGGRRGWRRICRGEERGDGDSLRRPELCRGVRGQGLRGWGAFETYGGWILRTRE